MPEGMAVSASSPSCLRRKDPDFDSTFLDLCCEQMPIKEIQKLVQQPIPEMQDDMVNDFEGPDSDAPMEKDATEVELEKLVFGDNSAFHEGLKSYKDASNEFQGLVEGERQQARGSLEKRKLEDLDDTDVCKFELPVGVALAQYSSSCSSSTRLRPW